MIGNDNEFFAFAAIGQKSQDLKYQGEPTFLEIGDHNVFRENCTVHRGTVAEIPTRIGDHNLLLCYSHVAHDCQVGNHNILSNNGSLAGHVEVADHVIVSGLAGVHQFCRIGSHAIIGGMAKVTQDVPPYMIIDGHPATVRGVNQVGLQRRGFEAEELRALRGAYKKLFLKKDLNLAKALAELPAELAANQHVAALVKFINGSQRGVTR